MNETASPLTIAVLGGTGKEGKGLAYRWARAGHRVLIGSRAQEKAAAAAADIRGMLEQSSVEGLTNLQAAQQAQVVVLAVPYTAHADTLGSVRGALAGKILIDVTVPLVPPKVTRVQMPPAGSAAQEARQILGDSVEIASAFHHISHEHLFSDGPIECDVLVTGTSKEARARTLELVAAAGLAGWDAGPLENTVVLEGLTSVLININKIYRSTHSGIRITGVDRPPPPAP